MITQLLALCNLFNVISI